MRRHGIWLLITVIAGQAAMAASLETVQKELGIPFSEGKIVDAWGMKPQVYLIQDIHRHPEAQQHIRAMILSLLRHGAGDVFLEGAWEDGRMPEYAFRGLEDPVLYKANVSAYQSVENVREQALQEIDAAEMLEDAFDAQSSTRWAQIRRLVELRFKPSEYAEYAANPYRPAANSALTQAVKSAEAFYELVNQRSDVFVTTSRALRRKNPQVLVVGGFHTSAMAEKLRREGVSYVVISPQVTRGGYDDLYARGMHETISALKLR